MTAGTPEPVLQGVNIGTDDDNGAHEAMMVISILTRRLGSGRPTGISERPAITQLVLGPLASCTPINAFDQREIIVVAPGEIGPGQDPVKTLRTDVKERLDHPFDAIIEPMIGRTFGIVVAEDDFSPAGKMELKSASVNGKRHRLQGDCARAGTSPKTGQPSRSGKR
jgi:hypothetical protein